MKATVVVIDRHSSQQMHESFEFSSVRDLEFQVAEFANNVGFKRYEVEVDSTGLTKEMVEELEDNNFLTF